MTTPFEPGNSVHGNPTHGNRPVSTIFGQKGTGGGSRFRDRARGPGAGAGAMVFAAKGVAAPTVARAQVRSDRRVTAARDRARVPRRAVDHRT